MSLRGQVPGINSQKTERLVAIQRSERQRKGRGLPPAFVLKSNPSEKGLL